MNISVVIPLYNKEHFVVDTIQSVLDQTYKEWEAIIINDGSTDNSAELVKSIKDSRIRYYEQENQGVSAARNKGIQMANGDLIALLDADDKWLPTYLETMVKLHEMYPDYSVFISGQKGRKIKTLPSGISIIEDFCSYEYIFWAGSMLICKKVYDRIGLFRVGVNISEDADMWLRISCYYKAIFLNEELVDHPYITENNLARMCNPRHSCPIWEWYNYPYPDKMKLYKYTTEQIVKWGNTLADHRYYLDAWKFLYRTKGLSTIRPRLKLLFRILIRK